MEALFYPVMTAHILPRADNPLPDPACCSEIRAVWPQTAFHNWIRAAFSLGNAPLYHQDISKLKSSLFFFFFFPFSIFLKAMRQLIFPSNFFLVRKMIMKNNFYF